jgi:hypothetical protein
MEKLQLLGLVYQVLKDLVITYYKIKRDDNKQSQRSGEKQRRRPHKRRQS